MSHVLVLNSSWVAIDVTDVCRAIILMFRGRALAVDSSSYELLNSDGWIEKCCSANDHSDDNYIRTVKFKFKKPDIILIKKYNGTPYPDVLFNRKNLYIRDQNQCQYCGKYYPSHKLNIDHVIPKCKGGKTTFENCVATCFNCNSKKANKMLNQINMKLIKQPIKPKWDPIISIIPYNYPNSWKPFLKGRL